MPAFGATTETDFGLSTLEADGSSSFLFDDPAASFVSNNPFGSPTSTFPFGAPEGTAIAQDLGGYGGGAPFNDGVGEGSAKSHAAADELPANAEDGAQIKKSISAALPPYSYGGENSDVVKWADCQVDYEAGGIERCVGDDVFENIEHLLFSDLPPLFDIPNHEGEGVLSSDPNPSSSNISGGKGKEVVENPDPETYYNYGGHCHEVVPEEGCSNAHGSTKRRKLLFHEGEDPVACGSGSSRFNSEPLRHKIEDSLEGPATPLQQGSAGGTVSGNADSLSSGGEEMQVQQQQPQHLKGPTGTPPRKRQTVIAKPFSIVKPSGAMGEITLSEINQRISAVSAQRSPSPSTHVPGKVFAQTKIITQGEGSITLYRTRVRDTLN